MATTIVLGQGNAQAVWDDRWRPLLEAFGLLQVERSTSIEWDADTSEWVAIHLNTGITIARGPHRESVVAQEVTWLEARQKQTQKVALLAHSNLSVLAESNQSQRSGYPNAGDALEGKHTS